MDPNKRRSYRVHLMECWLLTNRPDVMKAIAEEVNRKFPLKADRISELPDALAKLK